MVFLNIPLKNPTFTHILQNEISKIHPLTNNHVLWIGFI